MFILLPSTSATTEEVAVTSEPPEDCQPEPQGESLAEDTPWRPGQSQSLEASLSWISRACHISPISGSEVPDFAVRGTKLLGPPDRVQPLGRSGLASVATASCGQTNHSVSILEPGEMCPILLALGRGKRGPHHCAACRRGNRSRAAPAPQLAIALPEKPMFSAVVSPILFPGAGPQSRTDEPLELGGWTRAHLPPPPRFASTCLLPTRVRHSELLRAPSRVRARRGLEAPLQGRGGANACGAGRAEPGAAEQSRAEPSREVPGRGRQSLPVAPHPSCCVSRLAVSLPLPRRPQNFYCLGLPRGV